MLFAVNRPATVQVVIRDEDGTPVAPDAAPAVTVTDVDGAVVDSGTASAGATDGVYSFVVGSGVTDTLGVYQVAFTYAVDGAAGVVAVPVEVVSALLFDVAELRAAYPDVADPDRFTAAAIREARDEATERFETAAGVRFSTRWSRATVYGDNTTRLILPDCDVTEVLSVVVDGVALTAGEVSALAVDPSGVIIRSSYWPLGVRNITVEYLHGYVSPPPPVKRCAMRLAVDALVISALPSRATVQSTDLGEIRYSLANPEAGRPTGDPEVDAVISMFGRNRPRVGAR